MRVHFFAVGIICSSYFIACSFAQLHFEEITFPMKRFGAECVLQDYGCKKPDSTKILDKLMDVERNVGSCFQQLSNSISRLVERESYNDQEKVKVSFEDKLRSYCKIVSDVTECLKPLESTFRKCKHTAGIAFITLAKEVCKRNGSPLVEFMAANEKWCIEGEFKNREAFQNCLDKNFNSKTNDLLNYISKNTCKAASDFKECGLIYLDQCKSTEPKKIVEKYLNELKKQSPEAEKCFFQNSSDQNEQKPSATSKNGNPFKYGRYGSQKNLRPCMTCVLIK